MVTFEVKLVSANGPDRDRSLGVAEIENVGGTVALGDYRVTLFKFGAGRRPWRRGFVQGWPRESGGFDLAYRALQATVADRNPVDGATLVAQAAARVRVKGEGVRAMRALLEALDEVPLVARSARQREAAGLAVAWLDAHAPAIGPEEDE